jgi:HK97 family phage major capsid protein
MTPEEMQNEIMKTVALMRSEAQSRDTVHLDTQNRLEAQFAELTRKADEQAQALATVEAQLARQSINSNGEVSQHRQAFNGFVSGNLAPSAIPAEYRGMSVGVQTDGGFLAPAEFDATITKLAQNLNPWRTVAEVRTINGPSLEIPRQTGNASAGWVGEAGSRTETTSPTLGMTTIVAHELYANAYATQSILDDAAGAESFLAETLMEAFSEKELDAFTNGNGVGKPLGLFVMPTAAQTALTEPADGSIGYVATGASADFGSDPYDNVIDLVRALKPAYRQNAKFMFNRMIEAALTKVQATTGEYIWQRAIAAGIPNTILGYQIVSNDLAPVVAANAFPVAFGDFSKYTIVDRKGMVLLRDPYSAKPHVQFYATKRVGGGVKRTEAFKLLKCATS